MIRLLIIEAEKLIRSRLLYTALGLFVGYIFIIYAIYMKVFPDPAQRDSAENFLHFCLQFAYFPLFVVVAILFSGASLSLESTAGTLRYMLIGPVGRVRLVLAKFAMLCLVVIVLNLVIFLGSWAVAMALFESGRVWFLEPMGAIALLKTRPNMMFIEGPEGVRIMATAMPVMAGCVITIAALCMPASALIENPVIAVTVPLFLLLLSILLQFTPVGPDIKHLLPTRWVFVWDYAMTREPDWKFIGQGMLWNGAFTVVGVAVTCAALTLRDVRS